MGILGITILNGSAFLIAVIGSGLAIFSRSLNKKLVDKIKMDETRKRVKAHQEQYVEAQKIGDAKLVAKLEAEQKEIMSLVKKNMFSTLKPSLIRMPVILGVIWFLRNQYSNAGPMIDIPIALPFLTHSFPELGIINGVDWFGLYIGAALVTGLGLELIFRTILKKIKAKQ